MFSARLTPYDRNDALVTVVAGVTLAIYYVLVPFVLLLATAALLGLPLALRTIFWLTLLLFGTGAYAFSVSGVSITDRRIVFHRRLAPDQIISKEDIIEISHATTSEVVMAWLLFREMSAAHTTRGFLKIRYRRGTRIREAFFPPNDLEGFVTRLKEENYPTVPELGGHEVVPARGIPPTSSTDSEA